MRPFTAPSELVVYAAELGAALTRACTISATKRLWLALVCLGAIAAHAQNTNEPTPKTELGMGIAVLQFPAYRGSNQASTLVLPLPYLEYRGDFFKSDREGVRGSLFDSERVELSISVSGSPPTKSEGVDRRKGMPDLKPSLELGPQLNVLLSSPQLKDITLKLRLPLRQGITIENQPRDIGLTFSPNLNVDVANPWGWSGANLGFVVGPIFTSKRQNDNFYTVNAGHAAPARPAYQASGGYAGSQFLVSISRRLGDVWIGSYIRYDSLRGAVFADSPLVSTRHYLTAGFAVSYVFAKF
jgi:MipA family protein